MKRAIPLKIAHRASPTKKEKNRVSNGRKLYIMNIYEARLEIEEVKIRVNHVRELVSVVEK